MKFTVEDAVFFLDMINSVKSPNQEPIMNKPKPYYALFKGKDSEIIDDFWVSTML